MVYLPSRSEIMKERAELEGSLTPQQRAVYERYHSFDSHSGFFTQRGQMVANPESPDEQAAVKSRLRRPDRMAAMVQHAMNNRVTDPHGTEVLRVSFNEFTKYYREYMEMAEEGRGDQCRFQPFSTYCNDILYYADGQTPRPEPLRQFLQNEMGILDGCRFIVLTDAGPGERGDGRTVQVPISAPVEEVSTEALWTRREEEAAEASSAASTESSNVGRYRIHYFREETDPTPTESETVSGITDAASKADMEGFAYRKCQRLGCGFYSVEYLGGVEDGSENG